MKILQDRVVSCRNASHMTKEYGSGGQELRFMSQDCELRPCSVSRARILRPMSAG